MTTFVALYRGQTVANACLVAVSANQELVKDVSARLLELESTSASDAVIRSLEEGRIGALKLVKVEASEGAQ